MQESASLHRGIRLSKDYWNPVTELMPRRELERLLLKKLKAYLANAEQNSIFWYRKMREIGLKTSEISSLDDYKRRFPLISKKTLLESQVRHPPFGDVIPFKESKYMRVHFTSGTTAKPLAAPDTLGDWVWTAEMWCYGIYGFGLRQGDVVVPLFAYGTFPGFWGAHLAAEKIGCTVISGAGMDTKARIRMISEMGATAIICTPTYALRMAHVAEEEGISLSKATKVRIIICAGEPGANIPAVKKRIEEQWDAYCGDFGGNTEEGGIAFFECSKQPGGTHIIEDNFIDEVLDPDTKEPVGYGERGVRVTTGLGRTGFPLFRFWTNDIVKKVEADFCSCGRRFDIWEGGILARADDAIKVRGVLLYPQNIEEIVRRMKGIGEFLIQAETINAQDELRILVEPLATEAKSAQEIRDAVFTEIRDRIGLRTIVDVVQQGTIPTFELKARRFKDLRSLHA